MSSDDACINASRMLPIKFDHLPGEIKSHRNNQGTTREIMREDSLSESPVFMKNYGRLVFLREMVFWPINFLLLQQSKKHLANKRQLVVFSFDHIAHDINLNGIYEAKELETFFGWISKYKGVFNGTAIDIGANIGNHSLFFSDFFERVFSFEPASRTYKILSLNSDLVENITCFNVGISSSNREALLHVNQDNMGGSYVSTAPSTHTQNIKLQTLDSIVDTSEKIKLIKLDVEGHEYEALQGSEKTIKNNAPILLFEQHLSDFTNGQSRVINLLKSYGYSKFASIQNYPRAPNSAGFLFKLLYGTVGRLMFGESMRVIFKDNFEPGSYSFIVAIPDWIDATGT
ncbi:FkbM family methyltransferase [Paraburkholderia sediminicola]|uniref:FkbM family methyltransferase n=1 Tax=Paraburkholderia sediminicola TaxID=458836 RepID=UPI0038B87838